MKKNERIISRNILVVSDNYPSNNYPVKGMFLYQLLNEFSFFNTVSVICPSVFFKTRRRFEKLPDDPRLVNYAKYLSFSSNKHSFLTNLSTRSKEQTIIRAANRLKVNPDLIYVHFLWNAIATIPLKKTISKPLFVAMGESSVDRYVEMLKSGKLRNDLISEIDGFICVSQKLYDFVNLDLGVSKNKIILVPNGVDLTKFFPGNKIELRKHLGVDNNTLVISFIGAFIERKGIADLLKATRAMKDVGLICIGRGELSRDENIIFSGTLEHNEIPRYLSASDIFVFPTRAEGSSNALLEAAASGLPIITSNIPEVVKQIGTGNAKFVEIGNLEQLQREIEFFKSFEARQEYSQKSLLVAESYSLKKRAEIILKWINEKI